MRARGAARREQPRGAGRALRERVGGAALRAAQLPPDRRRARGARGADRARRSSSTAPERADALAKLPRTTVVARERFLPRVLGAPAREPSWPMDPDAIAILLFTSGTTGAPKAAVLRHKHLVSYILGSVEFGGAGEDEAALVSVPPYHVAGMAAIASSVYAGRRIVQLPSFSAEAWLETARRERVTHAFVVPTMLARIVDALEEQPDAGLPHLRALSYGGGKMPLPVIERAMKLFPGTDFTNAYGLTETSSTIAVLGPEDHRAAAASDDPAIRRRLTSVGRPLPSVEIEIRDAAGGASRPERHGEIYVRGEQVSGEYLGRSSTRRPRRLVPDARRRLRRRGRLPLPRGPHRRRDRARRREPVARRDRGRAARARGRRRLRGGRGPRRAVGRGGRRGGRAEPGGEGDGRRAPASGCAIGCARRARRSASSSATSFPTTRPGSCCAGA